MKGGGGKPVIKHSFTRGTNAIGRVTAHVNYLQYREGEDRAERAFFDDERDDVNVRDVRQMVRDSPDEEGVVAHRMIMSPGLHGVDMMAYTRETMKHLERTRGYDLEWRGIVHSNTDHPHSHVLIMGTDRNGKIVRFGIPDYNRLREYGEQILERDYQLERFLDREARLSLDRARDPDRGDDLFNRLFGEPMVGDPKERRSRRDDQEDRQLFDKFGKYQRERDGTIYRSVRGRQRLIEQQGRLSDFHEGYVNAMSENDGKLIREASEQNALPKNLPTGRESDLLHRLFGIAEPQQHRERSDAGVPRGESERSAAERSSGSEQVASGSLQQSVNQTQPKRRGRDDEESGGGAS